ncbi:hypothetical protein Tco_1390505 [Tanacetum coccineum]
MLVQSTAEQHEEPPTKKMKFGMDIHTIPTPLPLNSIKLTIFDSIPFEQFSTNLFGSGPSQYTLIPPQNKAAKGKGIDQSYDDDDLKKIMPYMEERGSTLNLSSLKHFRTVDEGPMTI